MFENFNFLLCVQTQKYEENTTDQNEFFVDSPYISLNCFDANMYATKENGFIN